MGLRLNQLPLHLLYPPVKLLFGALAGVAILLLEQADDLFGIAGRLFQVVVGEFAPPFFDLAAHFLPLAFEDILIHILILIFFQISCPCCLHQRSRPRSAQDFQTASPPEVLLRESNRGLDKPVVSSGTNTRYRVSQACSHLIGRLAFTDKRIRSGR